MTAPSRLTIATWNINSVRLRIGLVERFLAQAGPDILCLQETKCVDEAFPRKAFRALGYRHIATRGQRGYHGVATVSRIAFDSVESRGFCGKGDARHLATAVSGGGRFLPIRLHNFYVPSGGNEPDPTTNPKFAHKLEFIDEMAAWFSDGQASAWPRQVLVGDLNVAPGENDVWSHKQLLNVISHTPIEVEKLTAMAEAGGWIDVLRQEVPAEEKAFTWWSYRARDWRASNRGRRLDHIWVSPGIGRRAGEVRIIDAARDWERPSDHVPVMARIEVEPAAGP